MAQAAVGVDTVIHLAAMIPPASDEQPDRARTVNVDGTAHVIAACLAQPDAAPAAVRLDHGRARLHASTGRRRGGWTTHWSRPTPYSGHKIEAEALVRASGLVWSILRLSDVPVLGIRDPHPIMFEIGLDNRIESMHADDAGLAIANALRTPEVWGRVLFVGGGTSCQLTYRQYVTRTLAAMGIAALPDDAFSTKVFATDWLDTAESQRLLQYQRHSFDDITEAIAASLGWKRRLAAAAAPLARAAMLRLSPYYRGRPAPRPRPESAAGDDIGLVGVEDPESLVPEDPERRCDLRVHRTQGSDLLVEQRPGQGHVDRQIGRRRHRPGVRRSCRRPNARTPRPTRPDARRSTPRAARARAGRSPPRRG